MGTDIHMVAEVRRDGAWQIVTDAIFPAAYYSADRPIDKWNKPFSVEPYHRRNYDLFAMLADVRNGHGFAGIVTGEGFNPISEPKGIPEDASEQVKAWAGDYPDEEDEVAVRLGDHSHTWLTVAELDAYDWDQVTTHRGVFSERAYVETLRTGKPTMYSGDVSGRGVVILKPAEYEDMLSGGAFEKPGARSRKPDETYYIEHWWSEPYRESAGEDWFATLDILRTLGAPEDVRIVFGFDS